MKQVSICLVLLVSMSLATMAQTTKPGMKMHMKMDMPYKALYSSDFKMGNAMHAKMVLELWKDWDDNDLKRHDYFCDTVTGYFADGSVVKGKDKFMEWGMSFRAKYKSVKSEVYAWMPVWSTDKKESIVLIWGGDDSENMEGVKERHELHEVWTFNAAGKVCEIRQWAAVPEKKQ